MISIILPAYNEEGCIRENTLKVVKEMKRIGKKYEIIIVEESSDRTPEISERLSRQNRHVRHFHSNKRLGKGRAIEEGVMKAKGEKIIFMDVDLAVDLSALEPMINALETYDVAIGSRYHRGSKTKRTLLRLFLGRSYAILSGLLLGIRVTDFQCGFKGFKKNAGINVIKKINVSGVFLDTEFLFWASKKNYKIKELPVIWQEKKARNTKIGIKTIFYMGLNLAKLACISFFGSNRTSS